MDRHLPLLQYVVAVAALIVGVSVLIDGGSLVFAILVLLIAAWFAVGGVRAARLRR